MKRVLLLLICICQLSCVIAQNPEDTLTIQNNDSIDIIMPFSLGDEMPNMSAIPNTPPTPQAESFTRLGEYQVNNNYGAPEISIPLFNVEYKGFSFPLALHYEAQPLKPGYNYDVSGLGWTLSGNSCVSRTIRDRADEKGMFGNPFKLDSFLDNNYNERIFIYYADQLDQLNFQYDSYKIVLPSGRVIPFFMYMDGYHLKFDLLPTDSNVRISCSYDNIAINSFTVIDESGVVYVFSVADNASNINGNDPNAFANVSWMLSRIDLPTGDSMFFTYNEPKTFSTYIVNEPILHINRFYSQVYEDAQEEKYRVNLESQSQSCTYTMRFIKSISYNHAQIDFNYMPDGNHLENITISSITGERYKQISFTIDNSLLEKLVIKGTNETDKLEYEFAYTGNTGYNTTDYWGNLCYGYSNYDIGNFNIHCEKEGDFDSFSNFLNLRTNGHVRLLENNPDDIQSFYKIKLQSSLSGETRSASGPEYHKVLHRITYPNGGKTYFEYESHEFLTAMSAEGDMVFNRREQRITTGGGFRIKSITNITADGTVADERHYRYGYTYGRIQDENLSFPIPQNCNREEYIGCGEAVVDPNILTFLDYNYSPSRIPSGFLNMILGKHTSTYPSLEYYPVFVSNGGAWWWEASFSAIRFRNLLNGRRPVVYPEVTVFYGNPERPSACVGKTVYKYNIYDYGMTADRYYISRYSQTNGPDTAYFEPVHYIDSSRPHLICEEKPGKRHQLCSATDYTARHHGNNATEWIMTKEETYNYTEELFQKLGYVFNSHVSRGHCYRHNLEYSAGINSEYITLQSFYSPKYEYIGNSKLRRKETRVLYGSNARDLQDPIVETYTYAFGGKIKTKEYVDIFPFIDTYTYSGENANENDAVAVAMQNKNMLDVVTSYQKTHMYASYPVTTGKKCEYTLNDNGRIVPYMISQINIDGQSDSIQIVSCRDLYTPIESVDLNTGTHSVYLWDSSSQYLNALIKGATLTQVCSLLGVSIIPTALSDSQVSTLKSALPDATIETWTYKPLVGVTSHTDNTGQKTTYEYDGLGRLKQSNIVVNGVENPQNEYFYNYRNLQ